MVAVRKPISADAIYESGIYQMASVGGQEIDLTQALEASGLMLVTEQEGRILRRLSDLRYRLRDFHGLIDRLDDDLDDLSKPKQLKGV